MCNVFPAIFTLDRVALLTTPQDSLWPQLTVDTDGAVIVSVNVAELEDDPAGEPAMVSVYVPDGTRLVVEIVIVEVAPAEEGVMVSGANVVVPHGWELPIHTVGEGETAAR
jgi:hypothetical protein